MMVRDFQRVIGDECVVQMPEFAGRQPDIVIACVGGGSNAMGIFYPYIPFDGRATDRRRSRRRGHRVRQALGVADRGPSRRAARQPHLSVAGRQRPDHRDAFDFRRASTIPASAPSMPGSRIPDARATRSSTTTRRSRRSTSAAASRASFPRWNRRTRWLTRRGWHPRSPKDKILLVNLSGRGDKDMNTVAERSGLRFYCRPECDPAAR